MASAAALRFLVSVQDRDLKRLQADIRETNRALGKDLPAATGRGSAGLGRFTGAAKVAGLALLGGLALGARAGFNELVAGQKVAAQTAAGLRSTGGAAGATAKEIEGLAESISDMSGVDDEAIQAGQNLLLTFTKVRNEAGAGNDVFNQATQIMTDMSVAMGTDVTSGAIQLGKALNDPIAGVSALGEVGVSFTEAQKEQIKAMVGAGNVMGAQKLILAELTTEFGGSARAAGETLPGQVAKGTESFNEMGASIMQSLVPALSAGAGGLGRVSDFMTRHTTTATAAVGALAALGLGLVALNTILKLHTFFTAAATAAQRKFLLSLLTNPITLWIVALVAVGAALVVAYKKSETFRAVVGKALQAVSAVAEVTRDVIMGVVGAIAALLGVGRDIKAFFESLTGGTKGTTKDVVKGLGQVRQATRDVAGTAKGAAADYVKSQGVMQEAVAGTAQVSRSLGTTTATLADTFARNWDSAADKVVVTMATKKEGARAAGSGIGTSWISGIVAGANAGQDAVNTAFGNVVAGGQAAGRAKAKAKSPSEVTKELGRDMGEGLVRGVKEKAKPLALALTDAVRGAITAAKANVESLASGLASMIGTAIGARAGDATKAVDASPEGQALAAAIAGRDATATARQRTELGAGITAAAGALGKVDSDYNAALAKAKTAEERADAAAKRDADRLAAQEALTAAHVALADWEADQQIAAAQKVLDDRKTKITEGADAAKTAVDQGLADLSSAYARGKITAAEYLKGQKTIIAASGADFASIGGLLGSAFVTGFNEQIAALKKQINELTQGRKADSDLGPAVTQVKRRKPVPSHQHGIDYVPSTGLALLHRGERVVPAAANRPGASVTIHVAQMIVRRASDIGEVGGDLSRRLAVAGVRP